MREHITDADANKAFFAALDAPPIPRKGIPGWKPSQRALQRVREEEGKMFSALLGFNRSAK